ncbi:MAG: ABC transporter substrate-binding protein [Desulfobulbaceae bacterium]|nr:MAG: ABC transporter substrate-binding protein [Desulfobulbaceae bacterium]
MRYMIKMRYMKKSLWRILPVALLLFYLLMGCDNHSEEKSKSSALEPVVARLKWLPGVTYIGSIIAQQAGFWKEEGLDVTIKPGGFEADPIKLVASGAEQFGITGGDQLLQARANGVPIVAIFAELRFSPVGWMSLQESSIKTPHDLIGKKVGTMAGTNVEPMFDALVAKLNIDATKIKKVPVTFSMAPLFSGQVDALPVYLHGQPVEVALEGKKIDTINPADYGIQLMGNVVFTSEKLIKERPELVNKYIKGLLRAWQASLAEPDKYVDMMLKVTPGLKREIELASFKAMRPFILGAGPNEIGLMDPAQWQQTFDLLVHYAALPSGLKVEEAYDNSFIKAAYDGK